MRVRFPLDLFGETDMEKVIQKFLTGERALFKSQGLDIRDTIFDDGESPLKESSDISLVGSMFKWKYPLWYSKNIRAKDCAWFEMARAGVLVNLVMWAFNLFPLPPLDGGRILVGLLPYRAAYQISRVEPYGFFIVMALVISGIVSSYWLRPLMQISHEFIALLLRPLMLLFS